MPEVFERPGKEEAPVEYNAEWIISRSPEPLRDRARELIELLQRILPDECELVYLPRTFMVRYRGVWCIRPGIGQKQIWLMITHKGWKRPIIIKPETDLGAPEFASQVLGQFERTRRQIDSQLDPQG